MQLTMAHNVAQMHKDTTSVPADQPDIKLLEMKKAYDRLHAELKLEQQARLHIQFERDEISAQNKGKKPFETGMYRELNDAKTRLETALVQSREENDVLQAQIDEKERDQ